MPPPPTDTASTATSVAPPKQWWQRKGVWVIAAFVLLFGIGSLSRDDGASSRADSARSVSPSSLAVEAACNDITETVEQNPNMSVATALRYGESIKEQLEDLGLDAQQIANRISGECDNSLNNEVILGYGGLGPLANRVKYQLDRGTCAPGGDYGGTVTMTGTGATHTVRLELVYIRAGVIEHETVERIDADPGGAATAFEFFLPNSAPAGGACEVELTAVYP